MGATMGQLSAFGGHNRRLFWSDPYRNASKQCGWKKIYEVRWEKSNNQADTTRLIATASNLNFSLIDFSYYLLFYCPEENDTIVKLIGWLIVVCFVVVVVPAWNLIQAPIVPWLGSGVDRSTTLGSVDFIGRGMSHASFLIILFHYPWGII